MKVLKKGRPQKGRAKEFVCSGSGYGGGGCGATLLVEEGDLKSLVAGCFDEFSTYYWFECPECGSKTEVKNPWSW